MISQSVTIDKSQAETIRLLVEHFQPILMSDDLGIEAMFDILSYKVKVLDKVVAKVVVHGIVYYDFCSHDLFFDIEHQVYRS